MTLLFIQIAMSVTKTELTVFGRAFAFSLSYWPLLSIDWNSIRLGGPVHRIICIRKIFNLARVMGVGEC